jgi:multidrug efflux pump subunit AcrB
VITKSTGQTTAVMYIGFASDELSGPQISDYLARVVQPILSTVDGVASADILGAQTLATRIWLNPERMAAATCRRMMSVLRSGRTTSRPPPVNPRDISSSPT